MQGCRGFTQLVSPSALNQGCKVIGKQGCRGKKWPSPRAKGALRQRRHLTTGRSKEKMIA
jgi:hypothetical protein